MKQTWTNVSAQGTEIEAMRDAGKTRREITDALGLTRKQIKNWINRNNKKEARREAGIPPKVWGVRQQ